MELFEGASKVPVVERVNSAVRAYCVIILVTSYAAAFLCGLWRAEPFVSTDAYSGVLGGILVWWFKGRDDDKTHQAVVDAAKASVQPQPTNGEQRTPNPGGNP